MGKSGIAVVILLGLVLTVGLACGKGSTPPPPQPTGQPKATATVVPTSAALPTSTLTPAPSATPQRDVRIWKIHWRGLEPFTEKDEWIGIMNYEYEDVNLQDWVVKDITDGYPDFTFPHYVLGARSIVRVYTNERHEGSFNFESEVPVWNNSHPDEAALYDQDGLLVSTGSYNID